MKSLLGCWRGIVRLWRRKRRIVMERDGWKCRRCGAPAEHAHHMRYGPKFDDVDLKWIISLCADCLTAIHSVKD